MNDFEMTIYIKADPAACGRRSPATRAAVP